MGSLASQAGLFSLLPERKTPWSEFVVSFTTQAVAVGVLVWVSLLHPEVLRPPVHDYHAIELVPTPVPVNHAPQRQLTRPLPVEVARLDPAPEALHVPVPQPKPKVVDTPAPEVKITDKRVVELPPTAAPVIPRAPVKTNVFSTGSSAPQTIAMAPAKVQTGGFGDPNGVAAKDNPGHAVNIAQAGGFDMPTGPGSGNGTGGAKGARGVVASTGFGNGVATGTGTQNSRATVRQAGFGDADVPAPPTVRAHAAEAVAARLTPAEILSKPIPSYTEEARKLRVEGEVLLEVTLEATGRVHVLRIVRGLGHGLDDEAQKEAEKIRFKPAQRDGQPADSTVVLHIIFQLA
jgi:TonB family protein